VHSPSSANRAVSEWTQARRRALDLVLDREDVRVAVAHGAAVLGEEVVAIDVHVRSRTDVLDDWLGSLHGSGIRNTEMLLAPDLARAGRFVEERDHTVAPEPCIEYHLLAYDRDRFVARVIAQPTAPSERLRRRLNRFSASIAASLVEADRHLRAALPTSSGYAVLGPSAELRYADQAGKRWLEIDGVSLLAFHEVLQLRARAAETTSFVVLAADITIVALSGPEADAYLVRFRPADPIIVSRSAVLTRAQRAVAEYASAGATVDEIARALDTTPNTIRTHLREIYRRLEVATRAELAQALAPKAAGDP
jgi:DNA-binding CsgD family transcriptional regulator